MARVSGATVLLILVATVSVYTCAIIAGGALGRALDSSAAKTMQPTARDMALRVSVSFRGLAEDFVKELWGGNHRQGRQRGGGPHAGSGYRVYEARPSVTEAELEYHRCQHMVAQREATRSRRESSWRDGVHEGGAAAATAMPVSSDTQLWRAYHMEERRPGGGAHAGAGDRAEAALSLPAARAGVPLSRSEPQYQQRQPMRITPQQQRAYLLHRDISRGDGVHEGAAASTELWGGHHSEEGRSSGGARPGLSQAELQHRQRQIMMQQQIKVQQNLQRQMMMQQTENSRGGGLTTTARPLSRYSNFSDEITEGTRQGGGAVKVGPWGGPGGQPFYMRGSGGGAPRLLSIGLYHADAVHGLRFEYLLGGVRRTMGPSGRHYKGSKGLRATIDFSADEQLVAVEGTFGRCRSAPEVVVTSLTFRTDKGRTYGPYGEETGTPFSIPAANGCIVGFWGRSGWLLDAIGVYIMPCQEQVYKPSFFVCEAYKGAS